MKKEEQLNKLQERAREIYSYEEKMRFVNEKELSKYLAVKRLINFKVQNLIEENQDESNLNDELISLQNKLFSSMQYYKDNSLFCLEEFCGVALQELNYIVSILKFD